MPRERVTVLGLRRAPTPAPGGACSGYLVEGGGHRVWLDAGPGHPRPTSSATSALATLDAVVAEPRAPRPLGRRLPVYRVVLRYVHPTRAGCPSTARPEYHQLRRARSTATGRPDLRLARRSSDGSTARLGGLSFDVLPHRPPGRDLAVRIEDGDGGPSAYSADTGPAWSLVGARPRARPGPVRGHALDRARRAASSTCRGRQAGATAREAGVRRLVLTHLWPGTRLERPPGRGRGGLRRSGRARGRRPRRAFERDVMTRVRRPGCDVSGPRPTTSCGRSPSSATSPTSPPGSVLVSFGRTRVLCTASVDEDVPRWMRGTRHGAGSRPSTRMLPGSSAERVDREVGTGPASRGGPRRSSGSSAARCGRSPTWWPLGERADHRRLRRPPGRRRHPHGVDLRRLRRPARRPHPAGAAPARLQRHPLAEPCAADLGRHRRRRAAARPAYVEDSGPRST